MRRGILGLGGRALQCGVWASIWLGAGLTGTGCGARSGLSLFEENTSSSGGASGHGEAGAGAGRAGHGGTLGAAGGGSGGHGAAEPQGGTGQGGAGEGGVAGAGGAAAGFGGSGGIGGISGISGSGGVSGAGVGGQCTAGAAGCDMKRCGDGAVSAPEECDDGNVVSGDGCSATCAFEPRALGVDGFVCALGQNGAVKCWGLNNFGQLGLGDSRDRGGLPGEMGDNLPTVDLGTGRITQTLSVGAFNSCALLDHGQIKCWGYNGDGELGLGDTTNRGQFPNQMGDKLPTVSLGTGRTALAVTVGFGFSCAILDGGAVKCWGSGYLGTGDSSPHGRGFGEMGDKLPAVDLGTGRSARQVSVGYDCGCALLDDDTVKCWGGNAFGDLGLGDSRTRGTNPGELGDNLPTVELGTGRTARAISAGYQSTCALLDNATVKCWGGNYDGQLGLGDTRPRGINPGEMGDNLPALDFGAGRTVKQISAGSFSSCALLDNGAVKCWGDNNLGQLGQGDTSSRGDQPGEMGDNLPAVDLGTGRTAQAISTSDLTACALLDNGTVKCWGRNFTAALGLGDLNHRGDQPGEMGDNLPTTDVTF